MTEGELWARQLLAELRAATYAPSAWRRLLASSFERARERRREHARAHRQTLVLSAAGLVAWGAVGLAGRPLLAAAACAWWLAVGLMVDWHLGMIERSDGRPVAGLGVANALSLARAFVVPAFLVLPPIPFVALFLVSGLADALDGPLARRRDEVTRLGLWLDGGVDTVLLAVAALAVAKEGALPGWVVGAVLLRCLFPWLAVAAIYFAKAAAPAVDRPVSGRLAGSVLFSGLALAVLEVPAGPELTGAGAIAGLAAFVTARTAKRPADARSTIALSAKDGERSAGTCVSPSDR